jgi:hypothetical protein
MAFLGLGGVATMLASAAISGGSCSRFPAAALPDRRAARIHQAMQQPATARRQLGAPPPPPTAPR